MARILIIDDNAATITALEVLFNRHGLDCAGATDPDSGLAMLAAGDFDLVVQDMNFTADTTSGDEGTELFVAIRERWPDLPIVLLTAWTDVATAVMLVKAGAADYVGKPWDDERLLTTVRNLLELHELKRDRSARQHRTGRRRTRLQADFDLRGMVVESPEMLETVHLAARVARADLPVLLTGPSGAGKGQLAEIIQANSTRREQPFVQINAGALPAELIEAELFGVEIGAFTGASQARTGRFEAADGGTLFLDEIGNLSAAGQMKLLRVLESGEFEPLGSSRTRRVDVRIISATNADLRQAIAQGTFREDLYYRLNVIEIPVPPLAERNDDIVPLAQHFLDEHHSLSPGAIATLLAHDWPGNVRELANVVQRACLLAEEPEIASADLGLQCATDGAPGIDEKTRLARAVEQADGNISQAARALGISRQALYRRLEKTGADPESASD